LHVSQYKEIISSLKAEIDSLKSQLKTKAPARSDPDAGKITPRS